MDKHKKAESLHFSALPHNPQGITVLEEAEHPYSGREGRYQNGLK